MGRFKLATLLLAVVSIVRALPAQTFTDASFLLVPDHPLPSREFLRGASAVDFNNDGLIDLYHPNFKENGRLYLNRGDSGFLDILPQTRIDEGANLWGAAFGDYNNDGYLDILFEDLSSASKLYLNNRNTTFTQVNGTAKVFVNVLAQGAAWGDFNLDGMLDLMVVNDIGANQLFKNQDYQTFKDVTASARVATFGNSYGMSWGDINNDLYPDAFITCCHRTNPLRSIKHLLLNNGDETFTDINVTAGVADSLASWGVVFLDYDNDGDFDIYITNSQHPPRPGTNRLYQNNGDLTFTNASFFAGVAGDSNENSYGVAEADFNNDGWVDLYVSDLFRLDRLYRNNGDATFTDVATEAGIPFNEHRAIAVGDFNNDGWIDVFSAGNKQNLLFLNDGGRNHWIRFSLRGLTSNSYGVGARIEVYTDSLRQIREIRAGDSFCSQSQSLTAHFGLGVFTTVDSAIIKWPSGTVDKLIGVDDVDQHLTIVEGQGANPRPSTFLLLAPADGDTVGRAVSFRWSRSIDSGDEPLIYNLYLTGTDLETGARLDTVVQGIADTTIVLDSGLFRSNHEYIWSVESSDGSLITASMGPGRFFSNPTVTDIIRAEQKIPDSFQLQQNYPNPFNPVTIIAYALPEAADVKLAVYNLVGERVRTLVAKLQQPGAYKISWDARDDNGRDVPSGIYFYRITAGPLTLSKRMVLLR